MGKHKWDLHLDKFMTEGFGIVRSKSPKAHSVNLIETQSTYLTVVLVSPIMMFLKLTFFLLYLHIFYQNTKLKFCIYAGAFLSTIFYMGTGITQVILATPRHGMSFRETTFTPRYAKTNILSVPLVAVGLGIDLYILILPIGGVIQLHMPTRQKIGVCLVFITGTLFVIPSVHTAYFV